MKYESSYDEEYTNGDMHARHSLPNQFSGASSFLQDIAYSAQQALDQSPDTDLVPVDPALQAYGNGDYTAMDMTNSYQTNGDTVISSVEYQPTDPMIMDGMDPNLQNGEPHGPSVEPLTPGPPPHNDTDTHTNGYMAKPSVDHNAVRHPSSPVSPRHVSAASPYHPYLTSPATTTYNNFTTASDFPPPITPTTRHMRKTPSKSRGSKTPKSSGKRRDSKESIKLENGISMNTGLGMGGVGVSGLNVSMFSMIDPNLDQASLELIKQLQQEDLGLRRRSR
jgi:F-box/leucine-rich repeat protein 10/11